MATERFSINQQALTILRGMCEKAELNRLERWAIGHAIESTEALAAIQGDLSQTERMIRETELALSGEFEIYQDDESRR